MCSRHLLILVLLASITACNQKEQATEPVTEAADSNTQAVAADSSTAIEASARPEIYATVKLTADLSHLSENQKQMIAVLIEASDIMDELFAEQAYGDVASLMAAQSDEATRQFIRINYGPWDRLDANAPFVADTGNKPAGAQFYPSDMTKAEFEASTLTDKDSLYTLLRRDDAGTLVTLPYSKAWPEQINRAAELLRQAADLADDEGFADYLRLRARALTTDDYLASDMAWMDNKSNPIELVYGPIETYEDQLYGYKAAFESYVLIKDQAWSERLSRFAAVLPELQRGLPVEEKYRQEEPGSDADLNAYDVIYYAGDCNAGSKTIAINLPNDERVQLEKGTRRLQLKNAMRAKFDRILIPLAGELIAEDQRQHITFDAFFSNTMFHEVAHGLGIKNTLDGSGTVRSALKETASALEEGKADILGLYMVTELYNRGDLTEGRLEDNYVTFLASIFRSIRFGASSAHGRANMVRFNYFRDAGAFTYDEASKTYRVDFDAMKLAMTELSRLILTIQGDGDYDAAVRLLADNGNIGPALQADLDRLSSAGIPVDIVFEQGLDVLGLTQD